MERKEIEERAITKALRLAAILLAAIMVITVAAACSSGEKESGSGDSAAEEEQKKPEEKEETPEEEKKVDTDNITINTQSSIRIEGSKVIYFDPYQRKKESADADIILLTHSHYDHFDPESIKNVIKDRTLVIAPESMKDELMPVLQKTGKEYSMATMEAGTEYLPKEISEDIKIAAIPAYNLDKEFHKKEYGWLGYILTMDGFRYFDAGDTDAIPEHEKVECDIAFLPIGGTYTMTAKEAAEDVNKIKPAVAVPMHYGSIVGSSGDFDTFKAGVKDGIEVIQKVDDAR